MQNLDERPEDKKPEIDPLGQDEDTRRRLPGKIASFTPLIFPLVLAIVVSWAMVSVMAAPKGAYREDITRLELDIVAIRQSETPDLAPLINADQAAHDQRVTLASRIDALSTRLDAYSQPVAPDLSGYAKLTDLADIDINVDLSTYATKADVATIANFPTVMDARFATYQATITEMENAQAKLEARISELEEADSGTTEIIADEVTVEMTTLAGIPITFNGISETEPKSGRVKVKVTDHSNRNVRNVELLAIFYTTQTFPDWADSYPKLTGTPAWTFIHPGSSSVIMFATGWGYQGSLLAIEANSSKTFYPQLIVRASVDGGILGYISISTEISVENYEKY